MAFGSPFHNSSKVICECMELLIYSLIFHLLVVFGTLNRISNNLLNLTIRYIFTQIYLTRLIYTNSCIILSNTNNFHVYPQVLILILFNPNLIEPNAILYTEL